jgi:hypothetical protein
MTVNMPHRYLGHEVEPLGPITYMGQKTEVTEEPRPARRKFVVGIDLGQVTDFTAIVVLEVTHGPSPTYDCPHLERVALGTPYPVQVDRIVELIADLREMGEVRVLVDATGVGRPVVDALRPHIGKLTAVTITGGNSVSAKKKGEICIPKRDLVSAVKLALQAGSLRIGRDLPEAEILVRELLAFEAKITTTSHDQYEAASWREGEHDDLVLALAMAVWQLTAGPRVRLIV